MMEAQRDVVDLFERLLTEHGDSPRALDWSHEGQSARFAVLHDVGVEPDDAVLDLGCGLGHFANYLEERLWRGTYVGVDASSAMIEAATRRAAPLRKAPHKAQSNLSFRVGSALEIDPSSADVVVSSGMLNVEQGNNEEVMRALLHAGFAAARRAFAVNMLSTRATQKRGDRHYYDPEWALREAFLLTSRVVLRHDYRDNDFTLYLFRTM